MGEGSGRGSGRVRVLSAIAGRVGSTFRRVGSGPRKVTRGQLWCTRTFQKEQPNWVASLCEWVQSPLMLQHTISMSVKHILSSARMLLFVHSEFHIFFIFHPQFLKVLYYMFWWSNHCWGVDSTQSYEKNTKSSIKDFIDFVIKTN